MTKENSPQDFKNSSEKFEKLDRKHNLKINDSRVDDIIQNLKEALENNADDKIIETFKQALENAKKERLVLLDIVSADENKDTAYTFSTNMAVVPRDLSAVIEKIDKVLKDEEIVENKEEKASKNMSTEAESINTTSKYESISDSISDYLEILDDESNVISKEFRQYLNDFIKDKKTLAEKTNSEESRNDLIALENLYLKLNSPEDKKGAENIPEGAKKQEEVEDPSLYESIADDIKIYSETLDNEVSDIESEEIQVFVNNNIDNISKLLENPKVKKLNRNSVLVKKIKADLRGLRELNLKLNKSETKDGETTDQSTQNEQEKNPENKPSQEPEPISDYDYVIKSIIDDENPQARIDFLDEKIHKDVTDKLIKEIENKKTNESLEEAVVFISKHQERVNQLIKLVREHGSEQGGELLSALKRDINKLDRYKKVKNNTEPEKSEIDNAEPNLEELGYKSIDISDEKNASFYISPENEAIMKANPDNIFIRVAEAIGEYNKELESKSSTEVLDKKLKKIKDLQKEFKKYKKTLPKENKNTEPEGEKDLDNGFKKIKLVDKLSVEDIAILLTNPQLKSDLEGALDLYNEQVETNNSHKVVSKFYNTVDKLRLKFEEYKKEYREKLLNPEKSKEEEKPAEEESTSNSKEIKIFTMNEDAQVYVEMANDIGFDKWITNMDKSLRAEGVNLYSEIKDAKDWYKEYQETIPYVEKLNTVFEDIKNNNLNNIELLAVENKINDLIYKIHRQGDVAKNTIDNIFKSYTKSQEDKIKVKEYEKRKELKDVIEKSKNKGGFSARKMTSDQVKDVLESRGEENTAENINELTNFLTDFQENYDFYSSGIKEDGDNNIRYCYEKYRATGGKNIEPKKIGGLKKFFGRIIASLPKDLDNHDRYNHFSSMTKQIRSFNLVDRKDDNETKSEENKKRMSGLIDFCNNNIKALDKYLTDKDSMDTTEIESDPESKKRFETAVSLYKTFINGKYKTPEAKAKAESVLEQDSGFDMSKTSSTPTIEMLYINIPGVRDREIFETNAKLQINKEVLNVLSSEIETLKKSKESKSISKLETLQNKFNGVKVVLEEIGSDEDKEYLKSVELKLSVLKLKITNTENLKELSDSFPTYEYILSSTEITAAEKTEYMKELLKNLKKLRENKGNTAIKNAQLDAIIEKYQKVLKSIK